jgi:predicted small metal-binding protein
MLSVDATTDEGTPNAAKAMGTITDIVTHCRFEATAPDSDEVVLATILDVRSRLCFHDYTSEAVSDVAVNRVVVPTRCC